MQYWVLHLLYEFLRLVDNMDFAIGNLETC